MDPLVTHELQKYKLWIVLLSAEISPEGSRVHSVDIWEIIIQAFERRVGRFQGSSLPAMWREQSGSLGVESWGEGATFILADEEMGSNCIGPCRTDIIKNKAFTQIEVDHWALSYKVIQ